MSVQGEPIVLTEEELEAINELKYLRSERKDIEDREKDLRNEILQRLGMAAQAMNGSGGVVVKVKTQSRRTVDRAKLEAMYPEVFDDVISESEVKILEIP